MASAERMMAFGLLMLALLSASISLAFVLPVPASSINSAVATCCQRTISSVSARQTAQCVQELASRRRGMPIGRSVLFAEKSGAEEEAAAAAEGEGEEPVAAAAEEGEKTVPPPEKEMNVDDLLNSPAFLAKKVEMLEKQLVTLAAETEEAQKKAEEEWKEWGGQISIMRDEFQTLRARSFNASVNVLEDTKVEVVKSVLSVCDNFLRASQAARPETDKEKEIVEYYNGVYQVVMEAFKELGVTEVPTVGTPFDFNVHEAIMQQASELEEDLVCTEFAPGYILGDRLLRPAMVAVSAG